MGKKGKRLREFEKKNKEFSVRESKQKDIPSEVNEGEIFELDLKGRTSSGAKKNKNNKKTVINTKRLVASAVILIFIVSIGVSAIKLINLKSERDGLLQRQAELTQLKEELTTELEHIDSAEYIEQQARKNLRLIKKNELLFILSDDETQQDETKQDETEQAEKTETKEEQTEDGQAEN